MKILPDIAILIIAAFFCYAIGGFVSMRWDVIQWTSGERFGLVYGWIAVSFLAIFARRFPK